MGIEEKGFLAKKNTQKKKKIAMWEKGDAR